MEQRRRACSLPKEDLDVLQVMLDKHKKKNKEKPSLSTHRSSVCLPVAKKRARRSRNGRKQSKSASDLITESFSPLYVLAFSLAPTNRTLSLSTLTSLLHDNYFRASMLELFSSRYLWNKIDALIYPALWTKTLPFFLQICLDMEFEKKKEDGLVFREETVNTRFISTACTLTGSAFLSAVMPKVLKFAMSLDEESVEKMNETFVQPKVLRFVLPPVYDIILSNVHLLTHEFVLAYNLLRQKYEHLYKSDGKVTITCLFFLRFICPALIKPIQYMRSSKKKKCSTSNRAMIALAKILQRTANVYYRDTNSQEDKAFHEFFPHIDELHQTITKLTDQKPFEPKLRERDGLALKVGQLRDLIESNPEPVVSFYRAIMSGETLRRQLWALSKILRVGLEGDQAQLGEALF